jgi:serine/threonine protein kinase
MGQNWCLDTHLAGAAEKRISYHQKVALKLLKPEIASDRETIERFSNELRYARKISHRNICRMYDLGKAEGTHFITMEYIRGEDLKSFIHWLSFTKNVS